jgi:hypothetical protein
MTDSPNPVLVSVGWLLVVFGGLWTLLAGGCTLFFVVEGLLPMMGAKTSEIGAGLEGLPMFLMVGAVCVAPGVAMLLGGLAILRGQRRRA